MKKSILLVLAFIVLLIISMLIGYYIYKIEINEGEQIVMNTVQDNEITNERTTQIEQVDMQEEKVTPNTQFILEKSYKECGHTTRDYVEIPEEIVNMTEEQIKKEYQDWEIKKFTAEEVILSKETDGMCNQHYVLREKDGYIAVYWIEQNGQESLKEITGIAIEYLPENDLIKIKEGIFVYGLQELNSKIEDYE